MTGQAVGWRAFLLMAANAPAHLQRSSLRDDIHGFHSTMTLLALNTGVHVPLVGKTHKIRKVMNLDPFDGFVLFVFFRKPLNVRLICSDVFMAPHTGIHRRNTTGRGATRSSMAKFARDLAIASMQLMAKRNRLCWRVTNIVDRITGCPHPPGTSRT